MIPWYVKIAAKIVLSRLPISPLRWQKLNLFRAGAMDSEAYAKAVFDCHFRASGLSGLLGMTILELGPGNGLLSAKYAQELGAKLVWLIDSSKLSQSNGSSRAVYLTDGLVSLRSVPSQSVDFLFSNAVLEHVRLREFEDLIAETHRVLKPSGIASHQIDFRDHLGGKLNHLRFSKTVWESHFMAKSGFYTNRLPWPAMRQVFECCGFLVTIEHKEAWERLPTPQDVMVEPFQSMSSDDLTCWSCHVVLKPILPPPSS